MSVDDLRTATWVTSLEGHAVQVRVRKCRISVVSGADSGLTRDVESTRIRIGARRACHVQLSDNQVSGMHCEILIEDDGYRLVDLDSRNGTFVAGIKVKEAWIPPASIIQVGASKLRFEPLDESFELPVSSKEQFGYVCGKSVKMRELFARLEKLAETDTTILVTGETGVGKELVAESLHEKSPRKHGPFVVVDCGSIPERMLESELFGHERGAFTGAYSAYVGAFERAQGGTLFLDEISELPPVIQPKLLAAIERKEIKRIGAPKHLPVDVRVIVSTNRDLAVEVNRGRFREDLYYRIAVALVQVPPLRERKEDIPLLVEHFLNNLPTSVKATSETKMSPETIDRMTRHDWPGNVRELRNVLERAVLLSENWEVHDEVGSDATKAPLLEVGNEVVDDRQMRVSIDAKEPFKVAKARLIAEFEKRYVKQLLAEHGGNISAAARAAGIDRMSIHKMLNRLGLLAADDQAS